MDSERNAGRPAPPTVLSWLLARYPGERREVLQRFVNDRRVTINGTPATHLKQSFAVDDRVELAAKSKPIAASTLHPLTLVHEDEDLLVIDKPAALLTSTTARERRPTALKLVDRHVRGLDPHGRAWLIHRLDRDASGLLVFAKSKRAFDALKVQFYEHTVERQYLARVRGVPAVTDGDIHLSLVERADGTVRPTMEDERGEEAHTRYAVVATEGDHSLVRVRLYTGRKHQIRAHLAAIGHPLLGDVLYDNEVEGPKPPMLLRAMVLGLTHPKTEQWLRFTASVPTGVDPAVAAKFASLRE